MCDHFQYSPCDGVGKLREDSCKSSKSLSKRTQLVLKDVCEVHQPSLSQQPGELWPGAVGH